MSAVDWLSLMRAGLRGLGLKPSEFWALTPAEFALLLGRDANDGPLDRARLEALSRAFPDGRGTEG
ncbi:MAG: rcc01693 family protein [Pseudomonadota bacterium]